MAALQAAAAHPDLGDPYWLTICPWLLPSDRVTGEPLPELLLQPRRLLTPSPTPTMSTEDERQSIFVHPAPPPPPTNMLNDSTTAASLPPPPAPLASAPPAVEKAEKKDVEMSAPILTPTSKGSIAHSDSENSVGGKSASNFWQSSVLSAEPQSTETLHSQPSSTNGSQISLRPSRWNKARSTSTESGISLSGMTTLGSMYNAEGFPNYPISSDEDKDVQQLAVDDAAIAKQIALTDEAVRSINGTSSVFQARNMNNMMPAPQSGSTYELPRSMAAFVRRGEGTDLPTGRSFVSSGSSTSSEESEHLASVQWVEQVSRPTQSSYQPYQSSYFYGNNGSAANNQSNSSNPKMPPPSSTRTPLSPRNRNGAPNSAGSSGLPGPGTFQRKPSAGAVSLGAGGANNSSTPNAGVSGEGSVENDDDDQTVGFNREGSPSSSSASGLDLLSHAAAHHEQRSRSHSHTKRKAGAEAVAQWRESGIPSGASRINDIRAGSGGYDSPGYESTPSDGQRETNSEPPKKRRKSELEPPEARLAQTSIVSPPIEEADSDFHTEGSASDSEYHGNGSKVKGRGSATKAGAKAKRGTGHRVRPTLPAPGGGSSSPVPAPKAAPKKGRKSSPLPAAGGVQCEYINPLPPYQRCTDVFTRKYDIPRHMARHARREGDLVAEGRLEERKALLWLSIKDKPKIQCPVCNESFTRNDALKRHSKKSGHALPN